MNAVLPLSSVTKPRPFVPSEMQTSFFSWVSGGRGCAILEAVAGSGKSTTIVRALTFIPEWVPVLILAFNAAIVTEMKEKVAALGKELGRDFRNVRVSTFHSLGFGALKKLFNCDHRAIKTDPNKLLTLAEQLWSAETVELYGSFVCDLVSLAKGEGIGTGLCHDETREWTRLIEHHDLTHSSYDADDETAIRLARELLSHSTTVAKDKRWIDYDDMLYLPLKWRLKHFGQGWVFIDEAQDTNPARRAMARGALKVGGRLCAVGDRRQAIYGFTGASHDALDLIAQDFNATRMPLTVSYRCPQAALEAVGHLAPEFSVHASAPRGSYRRYVTLDDALKVLKPTDAVVCRNVAPLVTLAYGLMRRRVACRILGREIGAGLVKLVKSMRAKTLDAMLEKLEAWRERETAKFLAQKKEQKADAVDDRVNCVLEFVSQLDENSRTVPKLIAAIEATFSNEDGSPRLTLMSCHKAKGLEFESVALLRSDLMPSPWARQEWQQEQERNLEYVAGTRFKLNMMVLSDDGSEKKVKKEGGQ